MSSSNDLLTEALALHQRGDLAQALTRYRDALARDQQNPDAWHLMGMLMHQMGENEVAVKCLQTAIQFRPDNADFHGNLGAVWRAAGVPEKAITTLDHALGIDPDHHQSLNIKGVVRLEQGQLADAEVCFRRLLKTSPDHLAALANLGNLRKQAGDVDEARRLYERVLRIDANHVETLNNLGAVHQARQQFDEAAELFQRAIAVRPESPDTICNLASSLRSLGRFDEAGELYLRALEIDPRHAASCHGYANLRVACDEPEEAVEWYQRALACKPDFHEALFGLASALRQAGRICEAAERLEEFNRRAPDDPRGLCLLGVVRLAQLRLDDALSCFDRVQQLNPESAEVGNYPVYIRQFVPGVTMADLQRVQTWWDERFAQPLHRPWPLAEGDSKKSSAEHSTTEHSSTGDAQDADRTLRVGLVSPNFYFHPCGYFTVGCVEHIDRRKIEFVVYSDRVVKDGMTSRIRAAVDEWHDVAGLSDERLCDRIRQDRIDIAVAFSSHTARNRLLMFARRAAPVQVMWLGGGPSGMKAMDFLLADRFTAPPQFDSFYRETVLRLPDDYVCYEPPGFDFPVSELPAASNGYVTFGTCNSPLKIHDRLIDVWSRILHRAANSRMIFQYAGFDDPDVSDRIRRAFGTHGIAPDRIDFVGKLPHEQMLAGYGRIDIALDPFPFSGGLSTIEAIWMGVPVVTLPGETFASRTSLSHLSNVGLTGTVAASEAEYVDIAAALADSPHDLQATRVQLRRQLLESPVCDAGRFAVAFEAACREMWRMKQV